jgi:hypothetical protein
LRKNTNASFEHRRSARVLSLQPNAAQATPADSGTGDGANRYLPTVLTGSLLVGISRIPNWNGEERGGEPLPLLKGVSADSAVEAIQDTGERLVFLALSSRISERSLDASYRRDFAYTM